MHENEEPKNDDVTPLTNNRHGPRFMQPLILGFLHHFSIPVQFMKHLECESELESVVLMTEDQPERKWVVSVTGGRHFGHGWEDFCHRHYLQLGFFLVFTLESRFVFTVSVFDPLTACQIGLTNTTPSPSRSQSDSESEPESFSCYVNITACSGKRYDLYIPREFIHFIESNGLLERNRNITVIDDKSIAWELKLSYKSDGRTYICGGWKHFRVANCIGPQSRVKFQFVQAGRNPIFKCSVEKNPTTQVSSACQPHLPTYKANRTGSNINTGFNSDKKKNTGKTQGHCKSVSCFVTLSASSLTHSMAYIPKGFMQSSGLAKSHSKNCIVKLINEQDIAWKVKLAYRCDGQAYLSQGWRDFQIANNIGPRSFVRFQLMQSGRTPILKCSLERKAIPQASVFDPSSASKSLVSKADNEESNGTAGFESSREGTKMKAEGHTQDATKIPSEQSQRLSCHLVVTRRWFFERPLIYLPKSFSRPSGLTKRSCFVKIIDDKGIPWQVKLYCKNDGDDAYLTQGCKAFLRANNIKAKSVVCFELIEAGKIPVLKCSLVTSPHNAVREGKTRDKQGQNSSSCGIVFQ